MKESPVCGAGSGTATGRRVGYYQGWNTRERKCDKVSPRQINTRGLTHLFYSFAFFNPTTFEVEPMNSGDIPLYGEFTSLKRNGLQIWIAVGGVSTSSSRHSCRLVRMPNNVLRASAPKLTTCH
jgi:chitinase